MSFNVEEFKKRFKERADAVKDRPMPPVGGDERMLFMKQAELDFQDYMITVSYTHLTLPTKRIV